MNAQAVDTNTKPTVISTFCGTGGSSLGYHYAGFKELLAIDFEAHAVQCFKANFPDVPCWHRSVVDVTANEILDFTGLRVGELDVFDGSPPCQGFSTAGKRVVSDPRNDLFMHYWRLVTGLQPKVFVMENVSGMIKGSMKGKFIEIMNTLKSNNYVVKAKLLNAKYYGVPQSRERLFFIGVRKDLHRMPEFPAPNNKVVSFYDATKNIKIDETPTVFPYALKHLLKMKQGESLDKYTKGSGFGTYRASLNKPINTLLKQSGSQIYHPIENRCLSLNELKVLCSFPIDWKLTGTDYGEQVARLGNAVMPLQMKAIAETIKNKILI